MDSKRPPSRVSGPGPRAQSVFDYSVGISLFVVVVGVLVFVPGAFASFGGGAGTGDSAAAQRTVEYLAGPVLGAPEASSFRTGCALLLFGAGSGHADVATTHDECGFDSGGTLANRAGLQPINVTVEGDVDGDGARETLCWDTSDDALGPAGKPGSRPANCDQLDGDPDDDVPLTGGSSAADNGEFVVGARCGSLDGTDVCIFVRTW